MLYVSTRNVSDTYTAHRALYEAHSPDGGFYVPYRLPIFSAEEINQLQSGTAAEAVCKVLNLFFGLHLCSSDYEIVNEYLSYEPQSINQNLQIIETWHTPDDNYGYIVKKLYNLMTEKQDIPMGWAVIAIEIAILFGMYSAVEINQNSFDIAIPVDDFGSITAVLYAKQMGLPVNRIICACDDNGIVWDLLNKGEFNTNIPFDKTTYLEMFLYKNAGYQGVLQYVDVCCKKGIYRVEEDFLPSLNDTFFAAVVSSDRVDSIINGMYRSNYYMLDRGTAYAYGSLQDYRASVGANNTTIILSKHRPEPIKE